MTDGMILENFLSTERSRCIDLRSVFSMEATSDEFSPVVAGSSNNNYYT